MLFQYCGEVPPPLDSRSAYLLKGALQDLSNFMSTANTKESKTRQKLLRNLKVSSVKCVASIRWFLAQVTLDGICLISSCCWETWRKLLIFHCCHMTVCSSVSTPVWATFRIHNSTKVTIFMLKSYTVSSYVGHSHLLHCNIGQGFRRNCHPSSTHPNDVFLQQGYQLGFRHYFGW